MTSPTAKVRDNQSTSSSVLISVGGTALALLALVGFMALGGMTFISATLMTVIAMLIFTAVCAIFATAAVPLFAFVLIPLFAVGYILLGLIAVVGAFFYGFFRALIPGKKPG